MESLIPPRVFHYRESHRDKWRKVTIRFVASKQLAEEDRSRNPCQITVVSDDPVGLSEMRAVGSNLHTTLAMALVYSEVILMVSKKSGQVRIDTKRELDVDYDTAFFSKHFKETLKKFPGRRRLKSSRKKSN